MINEDKLDKFLVSRWNDLVQKEKGMRGIRSTEQIELTRIDATLRFISELDHKIKAGYFR